MKQKLHLAGIFLCLLLISHTGFCQSPLLPLTADSLATGNYKDVFKSFFQLSFDRLTSPDKEIRFTSNPFAVMAKMNPDLLTDTNYIKYTHLRNVNFSFAGRLDSSYRFNGFSSGITYALINKRDETVSKAFVISAFNANDEYNKLNDALEKYISKMNMADPKRALFRSQKTKMFRGTSAFSGLDTSFQNLVITIAGSIQANRFLTLVNQNPNLNIFNASQQNYDSLKTLFQNKPLWTIGISDTTYNNRFLFSNVVFNSEYVQGISNPLKAAGTEIDVKAALQLLDDTLLQKRDLKRNVFSFEPGLNVLFKVKRTQRSWAEFKLSGTYLHNFGNLYTNEQIDSLTLNATLRIRVINDIWIPLEIKYEPKSGNVFGLLNIRFNFSALGNLLTSKTGNPIKPKE